MPEPVRRIEPSDFAGLLDAPERAMALDAVGAAAVLAKAEGLAAVARARLAALAGENGTEPDGELITVDEAARLAKVTVEQFYRRRRFRPAIVTLGHRTKRTNLTKLRLILAGKRV